MARVIDKRGFDTPLPGNLVVERARVVRHVKINEIGRMVRLQPRRDEVTAPGVLPQRWWRVDFLNGSSKWFKVEGRDIVEAA